jgi:hypothetical protein
MQINKDILYTNYVLACWFFNKNLINIISKVLVVGIKKASIVSGFDIVVEVVNKNVYPLLLFLGNHTI